MARAATEPEPGPEDGGLRMRLLVAPRTDAHNEGFDVRVDLINTSDRDITLRAGLRNDDPGELKDYIEAATGIECVPAVRPWSGGVHATRCTLPQPEYLLKARDTLSVRWRTQGRQLENRVTDPNEVQNPEFPFPGLYSVHAYLDVITNERGVTLRSNEQLVPIGGSRMMPKYTFRHLLEVDVGGKTAVLDLGSRHKAEAGDQFMHFSGSTRNDVRDANVLYFVERPCAHGQRTLSALSGKDLHQKGEAPSAHAAFHGQAFLARMLLDQ